jgi:Asp-tRNA(Asn)/Glu-tRNA(Gln) amidotransferase C subunit
LDTKDVIPTAGGGLPQMPLRADEAHPGLTTDELLSNAPKAEEEQFKIPPVFE